MNPSMLREAGELEALRPVESALLRATGGAAIEWFGTGTAALHRAYLIARDAAGLQTGPAEVILPAVSCSAPANAALLAGVTPRFADVDIRTGMPTLENIQACWTPETCAVLFIHLFGATAELEPLAQWCRSKNILLIEDLAQSLGAHLPSGAAAGSIGDLSIYSFNPTKILECGGGALLVRSTTLLPVWQKICEEHPLPEEIDDDVAATLALSYRNLHHSLVTLFRTHTAINISNSFLKIEPAYRGLYLRRMKTAPMLAHAWTTLPQVLQHRRRHAQAYDESLACGPWQTLGGWRNSGVCWRYSLLVDNPERLVTFSEAVRHDGFHVSNLYWPLNDFFRPEDRCPNADQFARRIVNLWVDQTVDADWVKGCSNSLLRHTDQLKQ